MKIATCCLRRVGGWRACNAAQVSRVGSSFFQGGPPPQGGPGSKSKQQEFLRSKVDEADEKQRQRMEDHDSYYSDPSKPAPLFENAFLPGKFGMRRRLVVARRREKGWNAKERGEAVADAQTSFFK